MLVTNRLTSLHLRRSGKVEMFMNRGGWALAKYLTKHSDARGW